MKQRFTIIGDDTVCWTERESGMTAFHRGFMLAVERILPRPDALTDDRVVLALTRRTYRPLVNGDVADTDREYVPTIDEALEIIADAFTDIVEPLESALAEVGSDARFAPYEDWA